MDLRPLINRLVCDPAAKRAPDRATIEKLVAGFETLLESRNVEPSPFVVLRMHDVITQYRVARSIERTVFADGVIYENASDAENGAVENGRKRSQNGKQGSHPAVLHPGIEPLAKAWDRMRKALHDLEGVCGTESSGHVLSLADLATPILERADGVLEEAVAAETERRAEMRALEERNRELTARIPSGR